MSDPGAVAIVRRDPAGMITLRCDLSEPRLGGALQAATGCTTPAPRRIVFGADGAVAWMSPDELMLFVAPGVVADRLAALGTALAGVPHLLVDVSDARVVLRIAGAGAREVLAKGAPVDLAPSAFGLGDLRRTRLGQVAAALWMPEAEVFDLMCFRSVADHVALWLEVAARPGGLPQFLGEGQRGAVEA